MSQQVSNARYFPPDIEREARFAGFVLASVARQLRHAFQQRLADPQLTLSQPRALVCLARRQAVEVGAHDLSSAAGLQELDAEVGRQAAMLAYLQDFGLMMWAALPGVPWIALLRKPAAPVSAPESPALADWGYDRQLASASPIRGAAASGHCPGRATS